MPIPQPKKNESENDYMGRCMHKIGKEDRPQDQKIAICLNTFRSPKKKSKAEIEVDFSEDIKNMKKQALKVEEAPKIEEIKKEIS